MYLIKKIRGHIKKGNAKTMNSNKKHFIFVLFILTGLCNPRQILAGEDIQSKIDEYVYAYEGNNWFSGAILVAKDGKVLFEKGCGKADYENNIQNSPKTKFRTCSLTKAFTAMAVIQLEQKGMIVLNDKLTKFIPDYPNGDKITVHNLLTNTSGIVDHTILPDFNTERRLNPCPIEKTISTFKDKPLRFEPGEKFEYSNSNYIILGLIIEKVSGQSYAQYVENEIFKPLAMNDSGFEYPQQKYENFAYGYVAENDKVTLARSRIMSNAHASGALYSTVRDMYLWDRALYTTKLISQDRLNRMFEPFKGNYGYGWVIDQIFSRKSIRHAGEIEGYQSNITRFPQDDVCIIILSNFENAPVTRISEDIAAIIFGQAYKLPQKVNSSDKVIRHYPAYVGIYQLKPNLALQITETNNRLFCQASGQDKFELHPVLETEFILREIDAKITFVRDGKGKVANLILHQKGRDFPAPKIK